MEITLTLTADEVNGILATLGQLPTSSGAFPLLCKIKDQADAAIAATQQPTGDVVQMEQVA